ncbi:hypothetical protein GUITHDRAFT_112798 [Guillardia theta CCMP2712]|uniref:Uncharacterized protein n=1 Tax=Guillardia theta (strain CCMP2712) TaxID=905079 RepID=L1IY75_GUITC|nr:hypothetical protein GUITHDRAFT_112798 [Guillardia theta CCMP2712]EKX41062.1 hypothetical protein GUITHDRAFT_112798 [Guillardia theta CCMP2712]|eukprot:XP_005828042.1 hypothetical protein GUITHDRAFT_112798 [Guillardia theta CCMP2712]
MGGGAKGGRGKAIEEEIREEEATKKEKRKEKGRKEEKGKEEKGKEEKGKEEATTKKKTTTQKGRKEGRKSDVADIKYIFEQYLSQSYERVQSLNYECKWLTENLHFFEFPMLPPLHCWAKINEDDEEIYVVMKHSRSPCDIKIFTFMGAKNLGYVVLESYDGVNFRNLYSYARTRKEVFVQRRKQRFSIEHTGEAARVSKECFIFGHCIDFADTPTPAGIVEASQLSCNHPANIILEPRCSWAQVRGAAVSQCRSEGASYSQLVLYDEDPPISYECGGYPVSNGVVLFRFHDNRGKGVLQGWQVPWTDFQHDELFQNLKRLKGIFTKLRRYLIIPPVDSKIGNSIHLAYEFQKIPEWMKYMHTELTDLLKDQPVRALNPMQRYYLQLLADSEATPSYALSLILCDLHEQRIKNAKAWIDRSIDYCQFLSENHRTVICIGSGFLENLTKFQNDISDFQKVFQILTTLAKVEIPKTKWQKKQFLVILEEACSGNNDQKAAGLNTEELIFEFPGRYRKADKLILGPEHVGCPITIIIHNSTQSHRQNRKKLKMKVTKWFRNNFKTYPNHEFLTYNLSKCPKLSVFNENALISDSLAKDLETLEADGGFSAPSEQSEGKVVFQKTLHVGKMASLIERDQTGSNRVLGHIYIEKQSKGDIEDEVLYKSQKLLTKHKDQRLLEAFTRGSIEIDQSVFSSTLPAPRECDADSNL